MNLIAGTMTKLRVRREVSPNGWFLGFGAEDGPEVLLPYGESNGATPSVGDEIEVFIFHDDKERITATLRKPLLVLGEMARLTVADFHPRFGYFLEIGIGRQLLLPLKQFPVERREVWPQKGDELHVVMKHDKEGRMLARLAKIDDFESVIIRAPSTWNNEWKEGWVTDVFRDGVFTLVDGGVIGYGALGYIHQSLMIHPLRVGQKFNARVTQVREDGRVNLSIRAAKETGRFDDADMLLAFIKERPGKSMPYSDQTSAEDIKRRFGLSKSAFKRALGKLMKDGIVTQEGNWTRFVGDTEDDKPQSDV
ncbi:MAG: S1-like domain-containing RNA-binding protein [Candidatus Cohnella colombiensis]|uniref:S1-like domain-containing RNA-binding protein n=1 Tax=Candidatus Cohnella colombiensis TaxID=3121368 RepID=A0AA95EUQ6_9BACL|nr:MAG: S1-like domain-containing RNA-binding protein [Cohnella sp.]